MEDSTTILLVAVTILTGLFVWSRRTYVYWQRRRVKFVQPTHLLGNLKEVIKLQTPLAQQLRQFYCDERFTEEPLVGIYLFHQPALLIRNLDLVRTILIDDFVSFSNRFAKCDPHSDKLGALNLYFAKNPEWREIRTKLAPVFTRGKINQMFGLMQEIGSDLEVYLHRLTSGTQHQANVAEVKEICDLYTTDMIASIAFGLRSYSLRSTQSELFRHSRQMFHLNYRRALDFCIMCFLPKLVPWLHPRLFTPAHADFLRRSIRNLIKEREGSGSTRNDLIEMLLTLQKEADLNQDKSHFTHQHDYLTAQAAVFEIGGIEKCSTSIGFALYELARHPLEQQRLRTEIRQTLGDNLAGLSYDAVVGMPYLGMVVDETLRMYPIIPFLERECTPINKKRFYSFRPHAECYARRGMPIFISNLAIHYDPKYWHNPENFDPERFSPENRKSQIPMSYLPYGAGSHNCIGMAIGQLLIKLGLIHFLRDYRVEFCEKTVDSIKFDQKFALLSSEGGIYLRVVKCF